ncbi:MAG: HEAT repeat domain-containing protein [Acidobacteriota bacterium]
MILDPEQYSSASTLDLLREAARGYVPLDHRFLRAVFSHGEAALPEYIEFLKEPREEDRVEMDAVVLNLARHLRTPAALPLFAEAARVNEFSFPDELTEAFVDLGAESVETLLALYQESGKADDVAFALAALGVHDPRILGLLTARLAEDPGDAAIMLGLYGDPAAKPDLEKALAAAGEDERLKQELASAIEDLSHPDETKPEPFDIFPEFPDEDAPYFAAFENSELLEFLKSPVADYRARAIRMLGFDETPPPIVRTIFETAQSDPDPHVRACAWEALEGIHEPPEIEQALRARLADTAPPPEERAAALVALAHEAHHGDEKLLDLMREFYRNPETRAQALKAMWHSGDRAFETNAVKALDDPDLEVRRQAVTAIGILGVVSQLGRLESLFEDEDLRESSLYAYALAAPSPTTPSRMRKLFRKIEDLAGGFNDDEAMIVGRALDDRLESNEYDAIFVTGESWDSAEEGESEPAPAAAPARTGRNDPCPCGSGKKYKKCCGR